MLRLSRAVLSESPMYLIIFIIILFVRYHTPISLILPRLLIFTCSQYFITLATYVENSKGTSKVIGKRMSI